ncbi:unnamed protein product [Paramecium sonneborni]|uniref:Uncharacterized protein n=1 Tax=Paramecium sonneborni TaxID=65129 RepID=A0A8S1RII2_9CILI|nr:unnamed protein product [Paramecium sonneborni]
MNSQQSRESLNYCEQQQQQFNIFWAWQYEVQFSNLCILLRKANQECYQNAKNYVNELAINILVHNPDIQMSFKAQDE